MTKSERQVITFGHETVFATTVHLTMVAQRSKRLDEWASVMEVFLLH